MIFILTNRARLGSQKRIFKRRKNRYIAKYDQYKDIGIVTSGTITMPIFV